MLGRRSDAIDVLDLIVRERADLPTSARDEVSRLRSRVAKSGDAPRDGTLRGRDDCVAFLRQEWESAASGGARLCTLIGASGIGKTRVAAEFASAVALGPARVILYRCDAQTRSQPLALFSQILPQLRRLRGLLGTAPRHLEVLERLQPSLPAENSHAPEGRSFEHLRVEIQGALVDLLEAVSSEQRLLVVVDDAHLLDDVSAAVLRHLGSSVNTADLLIIACCRPGEASHAIVQRAARASSFFLAPLDNAAASLVVTDILGASPYGGEHVDWCVAQSAGSPFYLRALALSLSSGGFPARSFDVSSLASGSYFGLASDARMVLETCLLLGRFATLRRVAATTELPEIALLHALRRLSDDDLVHHVDGLLQGPHAILADAIRSLVPASVACVLKARIGRLLAAECATDDYSVALAIFAAENLVGGDDPVGAVGLLIRCASDVAGMGEPAAAASLLRGIAAETLPAASRVELLDALVTFAEAGGARQIALDALRERLGLGQLMQQPAAVIRQLEYRIVDAELLNGGSLQSAKDPLLRILTDPVTSYETSIQALVSLLIIADAEYDSALADMLVAWVEVHATRGQSDPETMRALLVYHSTFGNVRRAYELTTALLSQYPTPSAMAGCRRARRFAAYSLYRLQDVGQSRRILEEEFAFAHGHGILSEAMYCASLLTELAIVEGDFALAEEWFARTGLLLHEAPAQKLAPNAGYCSSAAVLCMMRGAYADAEGYVASAEREDMRTRSARYEAVCAVLKIRLALVQGQLAAVRPDIERLRVLFSRGRQLGGQDRVSAVLWCVDVMDGKADEASRLLQQYLSRERREPGPPDWFLTHTTSADEAWLFQDRVMARAYQRPLT
ncbi:MAG: ATP-binding protein [Gemmatimonadota bacterium]